MSSPSPRPRPALVDTVGLGLQDLHASGRLPGDQPLLRIDNLERARGAPFQFDAARGRLHRAGCRAIPASSESALYGVWDVQAEDPSLECPRCNPLQAPKGEATRMGARSPLTPPPASAQEGGATARQERPTEANGAAADPVRDEHTVDLLFGFLSVVSQFGGVLRERGQEYRRSRSGAALGARVDKIYAEVNEGERRVLDVLTATLETLVVTLRDIEGGIKGEPGDGAGASGAAAPPDDTR